jgi:two-component system, sporulation sensor kinase E
MDSDHPDDLSDFVRLIDSSASVTAGRAFQAEYRFKHKDGRYRWFHQQFSVMRNAAGQPLASIGSISDITERKQIADSFRQSEERFRLFENSLNGILFTAPDGGIYAANPPACQILGWSEQEICVGGRGIVVDVTDSRLPQALKERALTGRFRGELNFR